MSYLAPLMHGDLGLMLVSGITLAAFLVAVVVSRLLAWLFQR
jgi:hypothetical protein